MFKTFVFILAVVVSCSFAYGGDDDDSSFKVLRNRLAMARVAGLYKTEVDSGGGNISLGMDKDGGCDSEFIGFNINPADANFTLSVGNVGACTWRVTDVVGDAVHIELSFIEKALDPDEVFFANQTCASGCFILGYETGTFENGILTLNEVGLFKDLDFNNLFSYRFGGISFAFPPHVYSKLTFDDVKNEFIQAGVPLPPAC